MNKAKFHSSSRLILSAQKMQVSSDTQSSASSSRRNSSISSQMTNLNNRSRRGSHTARQSVTIDADESKRQTPVKVLVINGKCSEIFKSTIEECVEDCILEFPGEGSVYVPKGGQPIQRIAINRPNSSLHPSTRSNRRRSSITPFNLPQVVGIRPSQTNTLSLATAAITATSASRMRQQLTHQKFSLADDITEEGIDYQTTLPDPAGIVSDSEQQQISSEEAIYYPSNIDAVSPSFPASHREIPSAPVHSSYHRREKDFRLSDLVMRGPEYYAHVFNFSRTSRPTIRATARQRSSTKQHRQKIEEKYDELDRIKQDLFHRYLWTQKPQVSCRIRPISSYTRSSTFVL